MVEFYKYESSIEGFKSFSTHAELIREAWAILYATELNF